MAFDDPHQQEGTNLLSTSNAVPLQHLPNLQEPSDQVFSTDFTLKRFDSFSSRGDTSKSSYHPVHERDALQQQTSGWFSRNRSATRIEQLIIDRWLLELSACGGSLLALFAILIFLYHYDGRAQPEWPYNVTINSVTSLFTTVMKALMLVAVTSCLSQSNWIHFRTRSHSFNDFLVYDSASRGPNGSLQLLWNFQIRHIASIGALITILAVAVDPTVQQMVAIRSDQRNSTASASLGRAQSFLQYTNSDVLSFIESLPTSGMIGAIYSGLFLGVQDAKGPASPLDMNPSCPTGNCTFPLFQSLAVCSHCEDVSNVIRLNCPNITSYCEYSLPNGLRVNRTHEDDLSGPIATSGYLHQLQNTTKFGNTIFNFSRIRAQGSNDPTAAETPKINDTSFVRAEQCLLYWCINTYESRVSNGKLSEEVKDSWYSNKTAWWNDRRGAMNDMRIDLIPPGLTDSNDSNANPNFTVAFLADLGISQYLAPKLTLSNSIAMSALNSQGLPSWGPDETSNASSHVNNMDMLRIFRDSEPGPLFENLAKSMTRNIRNVNVSNQATFDGYIGPLSGVGPVNGTVSYEYVYVSVRWPWLAFSAALVLLTIIFLILTVIDSTRHDVAVWKSSPVPLLFHGLDEKETERLRAAKGLAEMEKLSGDIRVALKDDSDIGSGVRLVR